MNDSMQSGIYKLNGSFLQLYKEITTNLLYYNKNLQSILDAEKVTDDLFVFLTDDLERIDNTFNRKSIEYFFNNCSNIIEVHAEKYRFDLPFRFDDCPNLKRVFMPDNMDNFNASFRNTPNLESIHVSKYNQKFKTVDGVLYSKDEKALYFFPTNHEFKLSDKVTVIGDDAFSSYTYEHKELIIPYGVTHLNQFSCGRAEKIVLPDTIESVTYGFAGFGERTIYCSKNIEDLLKRLVPEHILYNKHIERLTLEDLIENHSLTEINKLLQTYSGEER